MTQNNFRKEPVFGEPLVNVDDKLSSKEVEQNSPKPYISLRSTKSPGHTFTPVMKRVDPLETAESSDKSAKEFQFQPSSDELQSSENERSEFVSSSSSSTVATSEDQELDTNTSTKTESFMTERVIPNGISTMAGLVNETVESKIPPKTRRLLLVGVLVLALLVIFFLLKPRTPETVEELQSQQGSSLPIEFRPVDEEEAKRAEEQARAEQEAKLHQQQEIEAKQSQQSMNVSPAVLPVNQSEALGSDIQEIASKPNENKDVNVQTQGNQLQTKVTESQEIVAKKSQEVVVKTQPKLQPKVERIVSSPKETTKTVVEKKSPTKTEVKAVSSVASISTKTMTIPKGVSLMQVFRDNQLSISDVNAMSKVNNVVSNLKVGERVTVRLDKNNRVVEMSIGSGGKFTRQANGSYTFK